MNIESQKTANIKKEYEIPQVIVTILPNDDRLFAGSEFGALYPLQEINAVNIFRF